MVVFCQKKCRSVLFVVCQTRSQSMAGKKWHWAQKFALGTKKHTLFLDFKTKNLWPKCFFSCHGIGGFDPLGFEVNGAFFWGWFGPVRPPNFFESVENSTRAYRGARLDRYWLARQPYTNHKQKAGCVFDSFSQKNNYFSIIKM